MAATTDKDKHLSLVTRLARKAASAAKAAETAQGARDTAILAAAEAKDPASYREIAEAAGITKDRVSQILQAERKRPA